MNQEWAGADQYLHTHTHAHTNGSHIHPRTHVSRSSFSSCLCLNSHKTGIHTGRIQLKTTVIVPRYAGHPGREVPLKDAKGGYKIWTKPLQVSSLFWTLGLGLQLLRRFKSYLEDERSIIKHHLLYSDQRKQTCTRIGARLQGMQTRVLGTLWTHTVHIQISR